jgi:hypothetical protein
MPKEPETIHSQIGGMAAGLHLKTIVGVLMSLCNDPHPVVHGSRQRGCLLVMGISVVELSKHAQRAGDKRRECHLGCIHSQIGGMAAGLHLKTIVGVLMSLCNDPHPVVYWKSPARLPPRYGYQRCRVEQACPKSRRQKARM